MFQQAAHPQTAHQKADIARADGQDIQSRDRFNRKRQSQYPPVQKEQHKTYGKHRPDFPPSDFLPLDALRSQAGKGKQEDSKQLRV